jgi:cobalt/nickel transport system ATP-binding protein
MADMTLSLQTQIIEVKHLTHRYATGRVVLDDVTFSIQSGERVALLGPNGAGKTTLFLRLCGVLVGAAGEVRVGTCDPALPAQRKQLPSKVGVVFQNPDDQLFAATVLDDVAFGLLNLGQTPNEARTAARDALHSVGLHGVDDRSPHRLSGGEKRRAALAGVLAMRPGVLLLDEPTMFLDPRGRRELQQTILNLASTLVLATHDLDFALACCPRSLVLDGGRLVADGPSRELMADRDLMEQHGLEVPYRLQ